MENISEVAEVFVPKDVLDAAKAVEINLLPEKSQRHYIREYAAFSEWRLKKNVKGVTEDVVIAYFAELSSNLKSSTLWSRYSMLRLVLSVRENVHLQKFEKLNAFLKKKNVGYQPKKSKTFTGEDHQNFFLTAPDDKYLLIKLVMVFGIAGACRSDELHNLQVSDVKDKGSYLYITLRDTKVNKKREFTITEDDELFANGLVLYKKYMQLRPSKAKSSSLFLTYRMGKVTVQPLGIHSIGKIPKTVALFLNLEDSHLYTGHCIRRTSATLLVESGADEQTLKRLGGWSSSAVAASYIEESTAMKIGISKKIFGEGSKNKESVCEETNDHSFKINDNNNLSYNSHDVNSVLSSHGIHVSAPNNCSFTFIFDS